MAPLIACTAFVALIAHADPVDRWRSYITESSVRFGIPEQWIEQVMRAESAGMTMLNGRPIRSRAGAIGLMQLMPATWTAMRARLALGGNPDDPRDNILAGAAYLRLLYDRFGYPGLFAAYNAGPSRYTAYRAGHSALPGETRAYLTKVGGMPRVDPSPPSSGLFAVRHDREKDSQPLAKDASLFALRTDAP